MDKNFQGVLTNAYDKGRGGRKAHIMHTKIVYTGIPFKQGHVGLYFKNTHAYQVIPIQVCAYYAYQNR